MIWVQMACFCHIGSQPSGTVIFKIFFMAGSRGRWRVRILILLNAQTLDLVLKQAPCQVYKSLPRPFLC